jgi:hypothetical protein
MEDAMKSAGLALALTFALALPIEARERSQPFKHLTGGFFALSVPNLAESAQWYSEKLGLSVILEAQHGDITVRVLEGGGLTVELIHDPAARPRGVSRPELVHGPFPASDNQRANLIIRDNAGNLIQIFGE